MTLYLGTHRPNWLGLVTPPLFVSRRQLSKRKTLPEGRGVWVLDSGGFTELNLHGTWTSTARDYAREVGRYEAIGGLDWVAPQDWMCEPSVRHRTGLSTAEHQARTVANFLDLRDLLGMKVVPVLQGWEEADYYRCVEDYEAAGVDLTTEPVVGVGSVCRRSATATICQILRGLHETFALSLHAFGVKGEAYIRCADFLTSADSMAWSFTARHRPPLPGCTHKACGNCLRYATRWHDRLTRSIHPTLWSAA